MNTQGHRIDRSLLQQQAQLRSLASAAQTRLRMAAEGGIRELPKKIYRNADYADPQNAPKDLVFSKLYGKEVSVAHPVVKLAPGVEWTPEIATQTRQMSSLITEFQQAFAGEKLDLSDPKHCHSWR